MEISLDRSSSRSVSSSDISAIPSTVAATALMYTLTQPSPDVLDATLLQASDKVGAVVELNVELSDKKVRFTWTALLVPVPVPELCS